MVNGDTDGWCQLAGDAGFLNIPKKSCKFSIFEIKFAIAQKLFPLRPEITVHGGSQSLGENYLQFGEGETTACPNTAVVLDSWASHNRAELVNWPGSNGRCLLETSLATAELTRGL